MAVGLTGRFGCGEKTGVKTGHRSHICLEAQLGNFTSGGRGRRAAVAPRRVDSGLLRGCLVVLMQHGAVLEEKPQSLGDFSFLP